jgi:hypothetical protein
MDGLKPQTARSASPVLPSCDRRIACRRRFRKAMLGEPMVMAICFALLWRAFLGQRGGRRAVGTALAMAPLASDPPIGSAIPLRGWAFRDQEHGQRRERAIFGLRRGRRPPESRHAR